MYLPAGNKKMKEKISWRDTYMKNGKELPDRKMKGVVRSDYSEMIICTIRKIDNEDFLKFLYNMLELFREKWGI